VPGEAQRITHTTPYGAVVFDDEESGHCGEPLTVVYDG
jgi:hypothetical protein